MRNDEAEKNKICLKSYKKRAEKAWVNYAGQKIVKLD